MTLVAAGDIILASENNDLETRLAAAENDIDGLQARCGVRLRRNATQTLNDNSATTVSWDTEDEDTDGFWAIGTPTVVTIPTGKAGMYSITASTDNAAVLSSAARGFIQIVVTSSLNLQAQYRAPIEALGDIGTVAVTIPLAAGDSYTVVVQADMSANSTMQCWLSCYRVVL